METINNWKSINELFDRKEIENKIKDLLINFDNYSKSINFKKGIYIYGSPGSGKTHFINKILKDLDFDIISYDAGDIRNKSLIDTITSNNISSHNVLDMLNKKKKRIAIIMDEIDGMNNGDKGGIGSLIKVIRQKKTKKQKLENVSLNPIICIGNKFSDKKIKELMKVCNIFELKLPNNDQIKLFLKNINMDEKIQNNAIKYIQGDLRKLQFIEKIHKENREILTEQFINNILSAKCHNEDSKNITSLLFKDKQHLDNHNTFMNENDRTIVSLLWHENVIDHIELNNQKDQIKLYIDFLNNICYADYIDRITFQNQIWQFNEMSSLMKTFYNNYIYHNKMKNKKITNEIRFTKVLTKYSTEYNNQIFLFNMCQNLEMDKKDLITFFNELRIFVGNDIDTNPELLEDFFENYNVNKLDIKRIYRFIDKNVKKDSVTEYLSDDD